MTRETSRAGRTGRAITDADRQAWVQWARERAEAALARGQAALDAGAPADARRWLERARRMAPRDDTVRLSLGLACLHGGDPQAAIDCFAPIADRHRLKEAWLGLALAYQALGECDEMAAAMAALLGECAADDTVATLAGRAVAASGRAGWCGLSPDGDLLASVMGFAVRIDGTPARPRRRGTVWRLPDHARLAATVEVTVGGAHLLGSPLRPSRVFRVEGCVSAQDGALVGWAWQPANAEMPTRISIRPLADGPSVDLLAEEAADDLAGAGLLARPRRLRIEAGALPEGMVEVVGCDGRRLLGSPLDPGLEPRSARAIAGLAAGSVPAVAPGFVPVPADVVGGPPAVARRAPPVDVVVPVYRDAETTLACLRSVLATLAPPSRLWVVDDGSPEPGLVAALDELARRKAIRLVRPDRNLGFPGAVNAGLRACAPRDAIVLNSDTLVAAGWIERLRAAAYAAADIGTATPLSNDATIFGYPHTESSKNPIPDLAATARLAKLAQTANAGAIIEVPTGHGFCLYLRRDCLDQTGLLRDDLFAQGYGEENDFCLRARHLGWRHVAATGVFVGHVGSASFGAARAHLLRRNLALLNRLHPGYDAMISAFIAADPLSAVRRRMDLLRWRTGRRRAGAVIFITHDSAGGVERVVKERAAEAVARGLRAIIIRPHSGGCVVGDGPDGGFPNLVFTMPGDLGELARMLKADRATHVEVHHLLGHDHAMTGLGAALAIPTDLVAHDYASFCPRITLVSHGERYCGEPDQAACEDCVADLGSRLEEDITVAALRARSAAEFAAAREVIAPSADMARRLTTHFPGLQARVRPWEPDPPTPVEAPRDRGRLRVCVPGAIGVDKGFNIVLACARDAARRDLDLDYIVVGTTIDDDRLLATGRAFITGEYEEADALALMRAQAAHLAFIPSIWPETWCFTLGLAWRAGLRAACFDIGAPAERIRRTGLGFVLPLGMSAALVNKTFLEMLRPDGPGPKRPLAGQARPSWAITDPTLQPAPNTRSQLEARQRDV